MMKLLEKYTVYDKEGTQPPPQVKEWKQNFIRHYSRYICQLV